ncbi:MAG: hypothetical protein ACTHWH_04990 [Marinobacter sp.]
MACSCSGPEPQSPAPGFRRALWIALWVMQQGTTPEPFTMGSIGLLALTANLAVLFVLFRFREGDSDMRSVWLCSRNDVISNLAVMAAALRVFGTGTAWPDLAVAAVMGTLAITAGISVIRHARADIAAASSHTSSTPRAEVH